MHAWEVDIVSCCLHSQEIPTPLFGKETLGSASDATIPLPLAFPSSCYLFFTYPATRYNVLVRDRPRHHHVEKTQYVSGGVFYLPFGFIDQPLALDEIQRWKLLLEDLRL